jgi:hypothetical protein
MWVENWEFGIKSWEGIAEENMDANYFLKVKNGMLDMGPCALTDKQLYSRM